MMGAKAGRKSARPARAGREEPSLDDLLSRVATPDARTAAYAPAGGPGPVIGRVAGLDGDGRVLLALPGLPEPMPGRSTIPVTPADSGREGIVFFPGGGAGEPILTGLLQASGHVRSALPEVLTLEAGRELTLKCGKATLRFTADGRIVIRGADLLTRASGNHRIKGGAVQIN